MRSCFLRGRVAGPAGETGLRIRIPPGKREPKPLASGEGKTGKVSGWWRSVLGAGWEDEEFALAFSVEVASVATIILGQVHQPVGNIKHLLPVGRTIGK